MGDSMKLPLNKKLWYSSTADEQDGGVMTEDELEAIDAKVEEFRQALTDRRKAEDLTTRELEARAGMSHGTISYIETRSDLIGIRQLLRLAAALNVELPDLARAFRASNGQGQPAEKKHCYPLMPPYRDRTLD